MSYRERGGFRDRGRERGRGGFTQTKSIECWTCGGKGHMSGKCPKAQCYLCYKKGYIAQFCPKKLVNLATLENEIQINYVKGTPRKMGENLLSP